MKFKFVTAVWGQEYTGLFLGICIPNQLTPGNLLCFANHEGAEYVVYTSQKDFDRINTDPNFIKVKSVMKTRIVVMDNLFTSDDQVISEYDQVLSSLAKCHAIAVEEAAKEGAALVFLAPDAVWSEGAFRRMKEIAASGKRVVAIPGVRVNMDTFLPDMLRRHVKPDGSIPIPPRNLVRLAMDNLHPLTEALSVDSDMFTSDMAFHLYWKIGQSGILARCLLLHPMMVYPRVRNHSSLQSFDGEYLLSGCPDFKDYYVVSDTDDIAVFELSPPHKLADILRPNRFSPAAYCDFVAKSTKTMHKFLNHKIRLHCDNINSRWDSAEKKSDALVRRALFTSALQRKYGSNRTKKPGMDWVRTVAVVDAGEDDRVFDLIERCGWKLCYVVPMTGKSPKGRLANHSTRPFGELSKRNIDLVIVASSAGKKSIFSRMESQGYIYSKDFIYHLDPVRIGNFEMRLRPLQEGFEDV